MWNLLKKSDERCRTLRDALEDAAARCGDRASAENLVQELTAEEQEHIKICKDCRAGLEELVITKQLFQGAVRFEEEERPWFSARVMAAIASRERGLAARVSAWTVFPRFASRVALITAVVLLAGTTWFYKSVVRAPSYPSTGAQESLFEAPQPSAPDDALVSRAGDIL